MLLTNLTLRRGFKYNKSVHDEKKSHKTKEGALSLNNNHLGGEVSCRCYKFTPECLGINNGGS